MYLYIP